MRTNIVLEDSIMETALKIGGFKTKKATIKLILRENNGKVSVN